MKPLIKITFVFVFILLTAAQTIAQAVDRTKPPVLPAPKSLQLPAIQKFTLSNGLQVVVMEKHQVPLVQLNLVIKAGSVNDPADKIGLANLAVDMIDEGAAEKTSLELADEIDFLGASIRTGAGAHSSFISLNSPLSKFDDALKIMSNIVLRPDFPKQELDRKKKDRLTSLLQMHDQPTAIAGAAFNKLLFGKEHPYGRMTDESTTKNFSVEDLKAFYKKYFVANNAYIVAAGDIKADELKKKLESVFGKWQKGTVKEEKVKEAVQVANRIVFLIDKPGAAQSVISIGRVGAQRLTPEYNALVVMNTILGGSFTSRLNNNLREVHGYTYGASSRFLFRPIPGSFTASSSVQTEVTDKALVEFFKELNAIRETIPADELNRGKNLVALSYPGNFQTAAEIAGQIDEMVQYNLPENYFGNYVQNILKVTNADVTSAANKYVVPEQMIVVVVGDKSKIEDGIKKLNLGEMKYLSIEEVLGSVPKFE
ncbi:MAG: M16B family peptidase [Ignavibacteria bacterium]|nr:MAG: M16B family peptidase [Ignavibacteria bacterium]KAF0156136.1 MAG: M16B family peptidase [Ignavibacteria bacterium]